MCVLPGGGFGHTLANGPRSGPNAPYDGSRIEQNRLGLTLYDVHECVELFDALFHSLGGLSETIGQARYRRPHLLHILAYQGRDVLHVFCRDTRAIRHRLDVLLE